MAIPGSCKHRCTQLEIQGRIRQVLTCRYPEACSSLFYSINYKNDSAVLTTALGKPNRLGIDHYIFWNNKGDYYQIATNRPQTDKYLSTKKQRETEKHGIYSLNRKSCHHWRRRRRHLMSLPSGQGRLEGLRPAGKE